MTGDSEKDVDYRSDSYILDKLQHSKNAKKIQSKEVYSNKNHDNGVRCNLPENVALLRSGNLFIR